MADDNRFGCWSITVLAVTRSLRSSVSSVIIVSVLLFDVGILVVMACYSASASGLHLSPPLFPLLTDRPIVTVPLPLLLPSLPISVIPVIPAASVSVFSAILLLLSFSVLLLLSFISVFGASLLLSVITTIFSLLLIALLWTSLFLVLGSVLFLPIS